MISSTLRRRRFSLMYRCVVTLVACAAFGLGVSVGPSYSGTGGAARFTPTATTAAPAGHG
jgi:hypothetical protein